jgi:hypothetical protein
LTVASQLLPDSGDLAHVLARVRDLTARYMRGDNRSFEAFRELADLLLRTTVMKPHGGLRLVSVPGASGRVLTGFGAAPIEPVPLNDGRFLRLAVGLSIFATDDGPRLKVVESSYQYQVGSEKNEWLCRYDYLGEPRDEHPQAHMQVNAKLIAPVEHDLHNIHFPTGRVPLEAVIRMLAEQFNVPTVEPRDRWRPILAASERAFQEIAHRPLSGPDA